jgi:hypothetical protein
MTKPRSFFLGLGAGVLTVLLLGCALFAFALQSEGH